MRPDLVERARAAIREDYTKTANGRLLTEQAMDEIEHAFAELQAA